MKWKTNKDFNNIKIMTKLILLFLGLLSLACGLEGVTDLNDGNFDQLVKQDSSIWLVLFAADWVINYLIT